MFGCDMDDLRMFAGLRPEKRKGAYGAEKRVESELELMSMRVAALCISLLYVASISPAYAAIDGGWGIDGIVMILLLFSPFIAVALAAVALCVVIVGLFRMVMNIGKCR